MSICPICIALQLTPSMVKLAAMFTIAGIVLNLLVLNNKFRSGVDGWFTYK